MTLTLRWWVAAALTTSCSLDVSDREGCITASDCFTGLMCIAGQCRNEGDAEDSGEADLGMLDAGSDGGSRDFGDSGKAASAPFASDDFFESLRGVPISVPAPGLLVNDQSPSGQALTAVLASEPAAALGAVTLEPDGAFSFVPTARVTGLFEVTYVVRDTEGRASAPATVQLRVRAGPALFVEAEDLPVVEFTTTSTQVRGLVSASDRAYFLANGGVGTSVTLRLDLAASANYLASTRLYYTPFAAIVRVSASRSATGPFEAISAEIDLYNATYEFRHVELDVLAYSPATTTRYLRFEIIGRNPASGSRSVGIDFIQAH